MQTRTVQSFILMAALAVLLVACSSRAADKKENLPDSAPPALPVDILIATETTLQHAETVAGSLMPNRTVDIMSELPRKVTAVSFGDGSFVKQRQTLYKLDDSDIRAKLRQLQAELNLARINEKRFSELLKTETVRQEEYDVAAARYQSLVAGQEILQTELAKTFIRAPFSGHIGITKVFPGTLVSPGLPLVTLQDQASLKVQFTVPEKYLPLVKTGTNIQFSTELSDEKITATVVSAEAAVDISSRNITVQAATANANGKLKAGMSARIFFNTTAENSKGIMVPTEALLPGANGYSIYLVKNGSAKITPVAIGHRNEKEALISSGVNRGDTVIISNILRAADGMPVSPVTH